MRFKATFISNTLSIALIIPLEQIFIVSDLYHQYAALWFPYTPGSHQIWSRFWRALVVVM